MTGPFDVVRKEFDAILKYSQGYPFDINAENLFDQWYAAKSKIIQTFGGRTIWRSEHPIKIQGSEEIHHRQYSNFLDALENLGIESWSSSGIGDFAHFLH